MVSWTTGVTTGSGFVLNNQSTSGLGENLNIMVLQERYVVGGLRRCRPDIPQSMMPCICVGKHRNLHTFLMSRISIYSCREIMAKRGLLMAKEKVRGHYKESRVDGSRIHIHEYERTVKKGRFWKFLLGGDNDER